MIKPVLTQRELKRVLKYDKETGIFVWKKSLSNRVKSGDIAGSLDAAGYLSVRINKKAYYLHRLAFLYIEGYLPENLVDHKDRNRKNNKWNNLREESSTCNSRNCCISKNNKSGITGVSWSKQANKWEASISKESKKIYIGSFINLEQAAEARYNAEVKLGYPNCDTKSTAKKYLDSLL